MFAKWLKKGLKHQSNHKGLLAQNNKKNAISHIDESYHLHSYGHGIDNL